MNLPVPDLSPESRRRRWFQRKQDDNRRQFSLAVALGLSHLVRLHLLVFGVGMLLTAASLQWEDLEWDSPVYGVVFDWLTPSWWAVVLILVGMVKLAACIVYPRLAPLALALGSVLFVLWDVGFITAYIASNGIPTAPLLALMTSFVVGEHLAVASLLQREGRVRTLGPGAL
jgi:hypothetical protein